MLLLLVMMMVVVVVVLLLLMMMIMLMLITIDIWVMLHCRFAVVASHYSTVALSLRMVLITSLRDQLVQPQCHLFKTLLSDTVHPNALGWVCQPATCWPVCLASRHLWWALHELC
jgi:hypothetical protein